METGWLHNFLNEITQFHMTEEIFLLIFIQLGILILIIADMAYRDFSTEQKIAFLALVVLIPFLGPLIYGFIVVFLVEEKSQIECSVCGSMYNEELENCPECSYSPEEESEEKEIYKCECGKTFNTYIGWKKHLRKCEESQKTAVKEPDKDKNVCEECGRSFDTQRGLHIHQSKKH